MIGCSIVFDNLFQVNITHCYNINIPNVSLFALVFAAINLKVWFKGMRIRYGKLTSKKSRDGPENIQTGTPGS